MRVGMVRVVAFTFIVWIVAGRVLAAEPQFTGLLNIYSTSPGFDKQGNSLAVMNRDGPVAGTVVPLLGNWSDIVVPPDNQAWYTLTHQEVFKISPSTGAST